MQSTKDKLIVGALFISILLGLIPVGFQIAHNFEHVKIAMIALAFFVPLLLLGVVGMYVAEFIGQMLKLIFALGALAFVSALPWIAIGFCIALGFALFHMI